MLIEKLLNIMKIKQKKLFQSLVKKFLIKWELIKMNLMKVLKYYIPIHKFKEV